MAEKVVQVPSGFIAPYFQWGEKYTSKKIQIYNNNLSCKVIEGSGFKTCLGDFQFYPGNKYYFEIYLDKGNLVKVGVSKLDINYEEAFCDTVKGWAIYNGELRHASNSNGEKYGSSFNAGDRIGVALDMIEGTLAFYKNDNYFGIAFKDPELKSSILYPACAPIYVNDAYTLRMMIRED